MSVNALKEIYHAPDGQQLFTQAWLSAQPRAVMCLVHGYGEHSSRYAPMAAHYNAHGYHVYTFDLRGHGQTEGQRGHFSSFEHVMNDIQALIDRATAQHPDLPCVLYGHSMGGNLVLNYVLRHTDSRLKAVVASGPWIRLMLQPSAFQMFLARTVSAIWPTLPQKVEDLSDFIARDPSVVAAYKTDPLVHNQITAGTAKNLFAAAQFLDTFASDISLPCLIMHGTADRLTDPKASEAFASRQKGSVVFKAWPDFYHELHHEPDKEAVFETVRTFLAGHGIGQ